MVKMSTQTNHATVNTKTCALGGRLARASRDTASTAARSSRRSSLSEELTSSVDRKSDRQRNENECDEVHYFSFSVPHTVQYTLPLPTLCTRIP